MLELPETNNAGFVYCITNEVTGQSYIGKKNCFSTTRKPPLKGKKRKRVITKESNWKTYKSSSKIVKAHIEQYGLENFTFEILMFCPDKGQTNYAELVVQIKLDVLQARLETGERKYLNENVSLRFYPSDKHSDFRERLNEEVKNNIK